MASPRIPKPVNQLLSSAKMIGRNVSMAIPSAGELRQGVRDLPASTREYIKTIPEGMMLSLRATDPFSAMGGELLGQTAPDPSRALPRVPGENLATRTAKSIWEGKSVYGGLRQKGVHPALAFGAEFMTPSLANLTLVGNAAKNFSKGVKVANPSAKLLTKAVMQFAKESGTTLTGPQVAGIVSGFQPEFDEQGKFKGMGYNEKRAAAALLALNIGAPVAMGLIGGKNAKLFGKAPQFQQVEAGPKGPVKFEIPDTNAKLNLSDDAMKGLVRSGQTVTYKLGDVLDHEDLFKNYPEMREATVDIARNNDVYVNKTALAESDPDTMTIRLRPLGNLDTFKKNLLHEAEHLIQKIEGFKGGTLPEKQDIDPQLAIMRQKLVQAQAAMNLKEQLGSWSAASKQLAADTSDEIARIAVNLAKNYQDADDLTQAVKNVDSAIEIDNWQKYAMTPGEAEAYAVEARAGMTPEQLAKTDPYATPTEVTGKIPATGLASGGEMGKIPQPMDSNVVARDYLTKQLDDVRVQLANADQNGLQQGDIDSLFAKRDRLLSELTRLPEAGVAGKIAQPRSEVEYLKDEAVRLSRRLQDEMDPTLRQAAWDRLQEVEYEINIKGGTAGKIAQPSLVGQPVKGLSGAVYIEDDPTAPYRVIRTAEGGEFQEPRASTSGVGRYVDQQSFRPNEQYGQYGTAGRLPAPDRESVMSIYGRQIDAAANDWQFAQAELASAKRAGKSYAEIQQLEESAKRAANQLASAQYEYRRFNNMPDLDPSGKPMGGQGVPVMPTGQSWKYVPGATTSPPHHLVVKDNKSGNVLYERFFGNPLEAQDEFVKAQNNIKDARVSLNQDFNALTGSGKMDLDRLYGDQYTDFMREGSRANRAYTAGKIGPPQAPKSLEEAPEWARVTGASSGPHFEDDYDQLINRLDQRAMQIYDEGGDTGPTDELNKIEADIEALTQERDALFGLGTAGKIPQPVDARTANWVKGQIMNDEVSSDSEMRAYFLEEGLPEDKVDQIMALRNDALRNLGNFSKTMPIEDQIDQILGAVQPAAYTKTRAGMMESLGTAGKVPPPVGTTPADLGARAARADYLEGTATKDDLIQHYVNLYRQVNWSNAGLSTEKLNSMSEDELRRGISGFQRALQTSGKIPAPRQDVFRMNNPIDRALYNFYEVGRKAGKQVELPETRPNAFRMNNAYDNALYKYYEAVDKYAPGTTAGKVSPTLEQVAEQVTGRSQYPTLEEVAAGMKPTPTLEEVAAQLKSQNAPVPTLEEVAAEMKGTAGKIAPPQLTVEPVGREELYGTGMQGRLNVTYDDLVKRFGPPNAGPSLDGKVKAEWTLKINGQPVSIYDYKSDIDPTKNTNWHIGGKSKEVPALVKAAMSSAKNKIDFTYGTYKDIIGTGFKGYIYPTYDELVKTFGPPNGEPSLDGKVKTSWIIKIKGKPVEIYDYKSDVPGESNTVWHVGGTREGVNLARNLFNQWGFEEPSYLKSAKGATAGKIPPPDQTPAKAAMADYNAINKRMNALPENAGGEWGKLRNQMRDTVGMLFENFDDVPKSKQKQIVKDALEYNDIFPDKFTQGADGSYTFRRSYFYPHGNTPEKYAAEIKKAIPQAEIVNTADEFRTWPQSSYHAVTFRIKPGFVDAGKTAGKIPAPGQTEMFTEQKPPQDFTGGEGGDMRLRPVSERSYRFVEGKGDKAGTLYRDLRGTIPREDFYESLKKVGRIPSGLQANVAGKVPAPGSRDEAVKTLLDKYGKWSKEELIAELRRTNKVISTAGMTKDDALSTIISDNLPRNLRTSGKVPAPLDAFRERLLEISDDSGDPMFRSYLTELHRKMPKMEPAEVKKSLEAIANDTRMYGDDDRRAIQGLANQISENAWGGYSDMWKAGRPEMRGGASRMQDARIAHREGGPRAGIAAYVAGNKWATENARAVGNLSGKIPSPLANKIESAGTVIDFSGKTNVEKYRSAIADISSMSEDNNFLKEELSSLYDEVPTMSKAKIVDRLQMLMRDSDTGTFDRENLSALIDKIGGKSVSGKIPAPLGSTTAEQGLAKTTKQKIDELVQNGYERSGLLDMAKKSKGMIDNFYNNVIGGANIPKR